MEKLDEEFIKVLKACDAHSNEYVLRLKVSGSGAGFNIFKNEFPITKIFVVSGSVTFL